MTAPTAQAGAGVYGGRVVTHGLGGSHQAILDEVRDGSRVLDVGCASGYVASLLAARGCEVVGFEHDPGPAELARAHCSEVHVGDIQDPADRAALPRAAFDFVLFGDVLEHLADPWEALRFAHELLASGGRAVVSLPNVAAWPVRLGLLAGRFDYADFGLLDRTHLRFFTRAAAHALVRDAGFTVERERFVHLERQPGPVRRALPLVTSVADRAIARAWPGMFAQQFVLRLRPTDAPRAAAA
jgi:2-polyprenyl-3-methyl-5-hydroxy-6-metoxy-1,4-benzoquinol methylase